MKKIIVALSVCLALLLGLCVYLELRPETLIPTEPVSYAVSFTVMGEVVSAQSCAPGEIPEPFTSHFMGLRIEGWVDRNGNAVDPFTIPVTADTSYSAAAYPELASHTPFLYPHNSELRPDDPLTVSDIKAAFLSLAAPGADQYFPELLSGMEPASREYFMGVFNAIFGSEAVSAVFGDAQTLTRAEFAIGMHKLMEKDENETFLLMDSAVIPSDITAERPDAIYLLEASVAHAPYEGDTTWYDIELPSGREPGFLITDGWLYYIAEDGYLLKDGNLGQLYFGADGRYTSGDEELDQIVAGLLKEFSLQNPEATRFELLRVAYDYCHQTFGYRRSWDDHPAKGSHGWEVNRAKDIFTSGKGNCYGFAAAFWALARGLGYEARAISGVVLSDEQPHSWCFIEFDGKDYIFDPQWQFDYTRREIYEYDMFFLPTDNLYFWGYQWFE